MRVGEHYKHGRYRVLQKLGWGHFSTVWLVRDNQTSALSALKVHLSLSDVLYACCLPGGCGSRWMRLNRARASCLMQVS